MQIFNGNFDRWTLATMQTGMGYGAADGWKVDHNGSSKVFSRVPCPPVPGKPRAGCKMVVSSVPGAGNYSKMAFRILNVRNHAGKRRAIKFYGSADSPKNVAVEIVQCFGTGGSPSLTQTGHDHGQRALVALTTSQDLHTVEFDIPSIDGKYIGTNEDSYLEIAIWTDAGSNFNTRTNGLGQRSGEFHIASVWIDEPNSGATTFPDIDVEDIADRCRTRVITLPRLMFNGNRPLAGGLVFGSWAIPREMVVQPVPVFRNVAYSNASGLTHLNVSPLAITAQIAVTDPAIGYSHCLFDLDLRADL